LEENVVSSIKMHKAVRSIPTPKTPHIIERQATPPDMATKERVLKFTGMQHWNPDISEEEFNTYWTTKHAVVAAAWLQKNGILGYTQVSLD
jgi:hypothetical protein